MIAEFGTLAECKENGHWWDFQKSDGWNGGKSYYECEKCGASKTVETHIEEYGDNEE
jgi:hypothetical protein